MKLMSQKDKTEVTVSNRTVIRVISIIVLTLAALQFLQRISFVLELLFIAFFLSLVLNPTVSWLSRQLRIKSRAIATGIAYIFVVGLLGSFLAMVVPPIVAQTIDFVHEIPTTLDSINQGSGAVGQFVERYNLQLNVDNLSISINNKTQNLQQPVLNSVTHIGSVFLTVITIFVLTFMFLVEGPEFIRRYWQLHPKEHRDHHKELLRRMYGVVTGFVNGQVLISAIGTVFAMTALIIASSVTNVSINIVAMGGIVFLFGLVPLVGNTMASVIVSAVCLFSSLPLAITMLIFFALYQQIENITLQPMIQAKKNELTPLLVFTAAIAGASLGGILGAFVAIPAAGCAKILIIDIMQSRGIGNY